MDFIKKLNIDFTQSRDKAFYASAATAITGGTMGYLAQGPKIGALYFYTGIFGGGLASFVAFSGASIIGSIRNKDDWINHTGAWSITGAVIRTGFTGSPIAGARASLLWAAGGGIYKVVGDILFAETRKRWINFRLNHSLPFIDDGSVRNILDGPVGEEASEFWRFYGAIFIALKEGKFPEPTYGKLVSKDKRKDFNQDGIKLKYKNDQKDNKDNKDDKKKK